MRATRFGSFVFANKGVRFSYNSAQTSPVNGRLPGLDGAFDEFGSARAPLVIGEINVNYMVSTDSPAVMQQIRDDLRGLISLGAQRLYVETIDPALPARWCWAKCTDVRFVDDIRERTDRHIEVTLRFQSASTRWHSDIGDYQSLYGVAVFGQNSAIYGGGAGISQACSGTSTSFSAVNTGNIETHPLIIISTATGQTAQAPAIDRLVNAWVVESIQLNATLTANMSLILDCATKTAYLQGADAYSQISVGAFSWLTLAPGSNDLRLRMAAGGNACTARIVYYSSYI